MQSHLNVDQWVMARDRHRLNRLRKGKDASEAQYQELFEKSNHKVRERLSRLPNIRLNQDLPVTQSADQLIEAIQKNEVDIALINSFGYFMLDASPTAYPMKPYAVLRVKEHAKDNYKTAIIIADRFNVDTLRDVKPMASLIF